ncbi:MAG: serine/threonine protein kinase [Synechococcaceae cyanobacterium SM2_3_1]|nr:serine/threonine protein kinase [Synechococcaceae cyanobacterium SM2_3_1]
MAGFPEGHLIAQRYRLSKYVGGGGMGQVYRAVDLRMFERVVAIKLLKQNLTGDEETLNYLRKRFEAEAQISVLLGDHPNITKVLDYGLDDGHPYIAMEFLGVPPLVGQSLAQILPRTGPMPPQRVVRLAQQVCAGLQYAHNFEGKVGDLVIQGVIHRDIKPSNLFVIQDLTLGEKGETVKILDFGIAKIVSNMTITMGTSALGFAGTLQYASPEHLRGKILDPRSDIYSLGVMLYRMLTGQLPLRPETDSLWGWIEAHNHQPPQAFAQLQLPYSLPAQLEAVIMTCLKKEPEARWLSMEALSQALGQVRLQLPAAEAEDERLPQKSPERIEPATVVEAPESWIAYITEKSPSAASHPDPPATPSGSPDWVQVPSQQDHSPPEALDPPTLHIKSNGASPVQPKARPVGDSLLPSPWLLGSTALLIAVLIGGAFGWQLLFGVPDPDPQPVPSSPVPSPTPADPPSPTPAPIASPSPTPEITEPSSSPTPSPPPPTTATTPFAFYSEDLEQKIAVRDWGSALRIINQMIRNFPDRREELETYRLRLEMLQRQDLSPASPLASPNPTPQPAPPTPTPVRSYTTACNANPLNPNCTSPCHNRDQFLCCHPA